MNYPEIRIVAQGEMPRAASVQFITFSAGPVMRWIWPEPHEYQRNSLTLVHGSGGRAFENDAVHATRDFLGGSLGQRHGFEVIREIRVDGSPQVFPMLRVAC